MPAVPEFILRKLYIQDSLQDTLDGLAFALNNTFAPATLNGFKLEVDGVPVPPESLTVRVGDGAPMTGAEISPDNPFLLPVNTLVRVRAYGAAPGEGHLTITVDTREAGVLSFSIHQKTASPKAAAGGKSRLAPLQKSLRKLFPPPALDASAEVDSGAVIGEISPWIYGQFVEHLEHCVYGGLWTEDGSALRPDTLELVKELRPPLIRYPGGNFASGYHWEDGIGPRSERPRRYDAAWQSWESNQVGTDEFLSLCRQLGAEPFLVVNDGSGTPEEAARWVAYCNQPADGEQGRRRAKNGFPEPWNVKLWGIGNEVWGQWQIGHTGAEEYAARLRDFASAMRAADPDIRIVAVGDKVLTDAPDDAGRLWNAAVLEKAGDCFKDLSFHLYQPDQEGWREQYDPLELHHQVAAAPLSVERMIGRISAAINEFAPGRDIRIALDEWNLWLPAPEKAKSMHQVVYTARDALYCAGMLNVFQRQCRVLSMATLAQLVNVLPLIVTEPSGEGCYATPMYYPFQLYRRMEAVALRVKIQSPVFSTAALGTIGAVSDAPYLDVAATRSTDGKRLALSLINRHPERRLKVRLNLAAFKGLKPSGAWRLGGRDPLEYNSFDHPDQVKPFAVKPPAVKRGRMVCLLPPSSLTMITLAQEEG